MGTDLNLRHTLRATLCEIERGLFHINYEVASTGPTPPGLRMNDLPSYYLGLCAPDAKKAIERDARSLGFGNIVWEEGPSTAVEFIVADHPSRERLATVG